MYWATTLRSPEYGKYFFGLDFQNTQLVLFSSLNTGCLKASKFKKKQSKKPPDEFLNGMYLLIFNIIENVRNLLDLIFTKFSWSLA